MFSMKKIVDKVTGTNPNAQTSVRRSMLRILNSGSGQLTSEETRQLLVIISAVIIKNEGRLND